jgi:rfaE bifunctional protein kinase chain/domain
MNLDADATRLLGILDRFVRLRILVMGDFIADEFIYGRVARVSREAPVLILEYDKTEIVPGGAGNAANNVAALGARTRAVGMIGQDEAGERFTEALHPNVERRGVMVSRQHRTPTKTRILAGGVHSAKQQVVRIDRGTQQRADARVRAEFRDRAVRAVTGCDAILVSDYGAGLITPALVRDVRRTVKGAKRARVPMLVDSRYVLDQYRGLTACTPNESEVEALLGFQINENALLLERAGRDLLERTGNDIILITRGSRGMALFESDQPTRHLGIFGSDEIADVTGAGDTVIATMTLALAAGASAFDAACLANYAGGTVVMKRGTATVSVEELRYAVMEDAKDRNGQSLLQRHTPAPAAAALRTSQASLRSRERKR